jgi:hypothetical protein
MADNSLAAVAAARQKEKAQDVKIILDSVRCLGYG